MERRRYSLKGIPNMQIDAGFIHRFGEFTEEECAWFSASLQRCEFRSNDQLLKEADVCRSLYFLESGAMIQYKWKDEIDQNLVDLHLPGEWVLNAASLVKQKPSETIIQAFGDSVAYRLELEQMHALIRRSPVFFQLAKLLEPEHSRVKMFDDGLSPLEKYEFVLNERPGLLQAFPLKFIASYLKMTPETLSRVREKLAR